jgi:uncharacterized protein
MYPLTFFFGNNGNGTSLLLSTICLTLYWARQMNWFRRNMSEPGKTSRACPICGRAAQGRYKPFCSARCGDIDLHRWLNESYRVPVKPEDDEEESTPGSASEPG